MGSQSKLPPPATSDAGAFSMIAAGPIVCGAATSLGSRIRGTASISRGKITAQNANNLLETSVSTQLFAAWITKRASQNRISSAEPSERDGARTRNRRIDSPVESAVFASNNAVDAHI